MSALTVIIIIAVLSLVAPFVLKLHKSRMVWITLFLVNLIIISLFVIVYDNSPEKIGRRTSSFDAKEVTTSTR